MKKNKYYKQRVVRAILRGVRGVKFRKRRKTRRQAGGSTVYSGKRRGLWF